MPKLYPITLYYNTKYDKGNIPDSPARLAAFTSKTFKPVFLRQDYGIATVRIDAGWEDVRDADYVSIQSDEGNTYFVMAEPPHMLGDKTVELTLIMDPLTTIGGIANLTVDAGWAVRAHVGDDEMFSNTLPEPWSPSQPMQIHDYKVIHTDTGEDNYEVVIATCDLSRGDEYKASIWHASSSVGGEEVSGDIIVPTAPIPGVGGTQPTPLDGFTTTVEITAVRDGETEHHDYTLPGLYAFDLTNDRVRTGINKIRDIGIDGHIVAMYVLPKFDVTITPTPKVIYPGGESKTEGMLAKISGNSAQYNSGMPYKYAKVKNNKAVCLFNSFTVASITSGDTNTFAAEDLYAGGDAPDWVVQTDPSPTGTTYCGPTYYDGRKTHRLEQTVAGLPWLNAGFTYTSGVGGGLGMMNATRRNQNIDYNRDVDIQQNTLSQASNITNGVLSAVNNVAGALAATAPWAAINPSADAGLVGNITGALGSVANTVISEGQLLLDRDRTKKNADFQMGDNLFSASVARNVVAPTLAFPISVNAAAYYGNGFAVSHTTLRENDLKRFDDFLSMYGYARDTKFVLSMLSNRAKHNYIKTSGALLSAPGVPRWILTAIANMFDAGVRIWHVSPSQADLTDNPIRS